MLFKNEAFTVLKNESMKKHTSFKIGGEADFYIVPDTEAELVSAIKICRENSVPYFILGNGSNLLVSDKGVEGAVISTENLSEISLKDSTTVYASCGASLAKTSAFAQSHSLSGFEALCGIPGTIGGAVFMNAGAYGSEIKDIVSTVYAVSPDGAPLQLSADECDFGYRKSIFSENGYIITGVDFKLTPGVKEDISAAMREYNRRRSDKQPLSMPSAGSTFKRPEGYFAGKLIEDCGLRGFTLGGASVSEKHCGFVVNSGNATCEDVLNLIGHIKKCVYEKFGVTLCEEVRIIGRR